MTIGFSANRRSESANWRSKGDLLRHGWLIGVLPLLPAWALALAMTRGPTARVAAIGVIAVGGAAGLSVLLWRFAMQELANGGRAWSQLLRLASCSVAATLLWVWLQYALNPFRSRAVFDAFRASSSAPWQAAAGSCLFASICVVAYALRHGGPRQNIAAESIVTDEPNALPPWLLQVTVRSGKRTELVAVEEIDRFQAWDDYVAIFIGGRRMLADYRLSQLASRLDPSRFLRVHRSHIVNLQRVQATERRDANRDIVVLSTGERIPASRSGSSALRRWLSRVARPC